MKKFMFASCLFAALAFTACSDDDNDNKDGGIVPPPTAEEAIEAFNATYDLEAVLNVDTATFNYAAVDGNMFIVRDRKNEVGDTVPDFFGQYFVEADNEYVYKVLDFLEDEVFPVFGTEFIKKYMPRTIYFASEVQYHGYYIDKDFGHTSIAKDFYFPFEGGIVCPQYMMLSHCCADFDTMDKEYLKRLYVSLVTEYIFTNIENSSLETPETFNDYSLKYTQGFEFWGIIFSLNGNSDGYYESSSDEFSVGYSNDYSWFDTVEEIENSENLWYLPTAWFNCELRPARIGASELHKNNATTMEKYGYPKVYYTIYLRPSLAQVMGDYVAFIVTTTADEKDAYFAEVQKAIDNAGIPDDMTSPVFQDSFVGEVQPTVDDVIPDMKARIQACIEYFATYNITLADKQ